ncbi:uncharacterized protein LOC128187279 [Crassostrea angulata]|uniref:Uncharacterized protein n=1 Tax=Magallana gigas TaxID=29159 RepID=A0A8W8KBX1_MAGGI|nr:uncharacterized protein LOC105336019 [Crassostrea gigas]XP_011438482.1 uncharacterized protein LOC105336019 [Crassostrea gigas]XP_034339388.1 uncharacterized protein LOC105336019 [Crassostrea gigas]XP_034339389.1 uncharacterized protein LOC105336019 [Crassostrea gigas]XP_052713559.1 uncharacterized protein LOC128187279 [Crassostrea angulata]XP_052713560.1 uncharacterized protein LOC128187279 [Crassostrea angulata]|eukprot:XP_011438481.1 PREDICTED: uncharacterized protein LOC105336019 [Crassostrea gigas]
MGRNKQKDKQKGSGKGKKESAVFKVAGVRKPKIKSVNTNLKKLNFKNKQKTEDSNKVFNSVQESITETTKLTKKRPISKSSTAKKPLPDMDEAAKQFAQL